MTVTLPRARRGDVRPRAPQDSFALYLQEIGSHPLIGPEEERRLARRIRAGDRGALDRMVESNLRFVVSVARRYRHLGVPLQDLVTEGNLGLLEAAERFDERKGVRFTSYAVWWVRQSIISAIRQQIGIVRVPVSKRRGRLALERGPMPRRSKSHARDGETPETPGLKTDPRSPFGVRYLSLDAPLGDPRGTRGTILGELVAREAVVDPADRVDRAALRDLLERSLTLLDEREARVVRLSFGLEDGDPQSLGEIGDRMGVSRERVRQIRERALVRLRSGVLRRNLESFYR
jgi:RNA polymerase primary sigma factor